MGNGPKQAPGGGAAAACVLPDAALVHTHTHTHTVDKYAAQFRAGTPFPYLHVCDVFNEDMLRAVKAELEAVEFFQKRNDLYDFLQSDTLARAQGNATAQFRKYLYGDEFRSWMQRITGIETTPTVDISVAQYVDGSYLLCHDDDLSERRIAFIIYLVPEDWAAEDGGSLDLYSATPDGAPDAIVRRLVPAWNSIAFFEVSPISHHQVAEVLNAEKGSRMSISGWFHGKPIPRPPVKPLPPVVYVSPPEPSEDAGVITVAAGAAQKKGGKKPRAAAPASAASAAADASTPVSFLVTVADGKSDALTAWINPMYLRASVLAQMREQYTSNASIELAAFISEDVYAEVMMALACQRWQHVGPPNMRSMKVLPHLSADAATTSGAIADYNGLLPDHVARLYNFLTGFQFMSLVAAITQTRLEGVSGQVRCFTRGDYTLVYDPEYKEEQKRAKADKLGVKHGETASAGAASAPAVAGSKRAASTAVEPVTPSAAGRTTLDVMLTFVVSEEWPEEHGGYVSYLTADDELLTVIPKQNSLSIVCREPGVMSFVKYVSHHAQENRYDFALSFLVAEE